MEFRIAPLIMALFLLIYLLFIHPAINSHMPLSAVTHFSKVLLPVALLLILSWSTYFRHHYLSTSYKLIFWVVQILNGSLIAWFFYYLHQQHVL